MLVSEIDKRGIVKKAKLRVYSLQADVGVFEDKGVNFYAHFTQWVV